MKRTRYGSFRTRVDDSRCLGGGASSGRRGFTLVELAIASIIFLAMMGAVFQMFVKGSRAGAKATWRAQVTGKSRAAIRQIKAAVEASSYPSAVSFTDYIEDRAGYGFAIGPPDSSVAGTDVTTHIFSTNNANVLTFYACHPAVPDVTGTGGGAGSAVQYVFSLEDSHYYGSSRRDLRITSSQALVTENSGSVNVGAFTEVSSIRVATELERFEIEVPNTRQEGRAVITLRLVCRDPVDGFMRVVEESRANVNVAITP